jgi:hypothetical protein
MEQEFRDELLRSRESLFHDADKQRLLAALRLRFPEMKTAYVLGWTPEQGEDIFRILINTDHIAGVELDRIDTVAEPVIETISMKDYTQALGKSGRIKLAVAIELARRDAAEQGL